MRVYVCARQNSIDCILVHTALFAIHTFVAICVSVEGSSTTAKPPQKTKRCAAALATTVAPGLLCRTEDLGQAHGAYGKKHPEKSVLRLPKTHSNPQPQRKTTWTRRWLFKEAISKGLPFSDRKVLLIVKWHWHPFHSLAHPCPRDALHAPFTSAGSHQKYLCC